MTTAKNKLAALRAQFGDKKSEGGNRESFGNNKYYPFWNMENGHRAVIRFLPDVDDTNSRGFLVEKSTHTLTVNGQTRSVPCLAMYDQECPVCKVSQEYYKAGDKINGKKYWRKKQYVAQALIVEDPLPADKETGLTHQGEVRQITLGYQLYNIIKEAFASGDDLEASPDDMQDGYDFIIKKSQQGEYSSYTMGTKFQSRPRALTESEISTAEAGSVELKTMLPRNPGVESVRAMLNADLNGENYSDKPTGTNNDDEGDDLPMIQKPKAAAPSAPVPQAKAAPADDSASTTDVDEMLAVIKARRAAKQQ